MAGEQDPNFKDPHEKQPGEKKPGKFHYNPGNMSGKTVEIGKEAAEKEGEPDREHRDDKR